MKWDLPGLRPRSLAQRTPIDSLLFDRTRSGMRQPSSKSAGYQKLIACRLILPAEKMAGFRPAIFSCCGTDRAQMTQWQ
jgi:hypothetical protein